VKVQTDPISFIKSNNVEVQTNATKVDEPGLSILMMLFGISVTFTAGTLSHQLVKLYRSYWRSGDIFSKIRALDSNEPLTVDEKLAREM
jgi:hypothetical protein